MHLKQTSVTDNKGKRGWILRRSMRILLYVLLVLLTLRGGLADAEAAGVKSPKIVSAAKVINKDITVKLKSRTKKAELYYTTNGSTPVKGKKGTKHYSSSKGIKITKTTTIKARAYRKGKKSKVASLTITYLKPLTIKKLVIENDFVRIQWKASKDASGYYIYRKEAGKSFKCIETLNGGQNKTWLDKSVKLNKKYSYMVIPFRGKIRARLGNKAKAKTIKVIHTHVGVLSREGVYTVETCKKCGEQLRKYLAEDIPEYWSEEILGALATARSHGDLPCYIYVTDVHWRKNAKKSPAIINYISEAMGGALAVFGGDAIYYYQKTIAGAINELKDFYSRFTCKVFSTTGNHDFNKSGNPDKTTRLTTADLFNLMYARESSFAHLDGGSEYSYIDDTKNKIRMISFQFETSADVPASIIDWIDKRVCELPEDWTVVLFSHAYWGYDKTAKIAIPKSHAKNLVPQLMEIQAHSKATIALWQVGHIHMDFTEVLQIQKTVEKPADTETPAESSTESSEMTPEENPKDPGSGQGTEQGSEQGGSQGSEQGGSQSSEQGGSQGTEPPETETVTVSLLAVSTTTDNYTLAPSIGPAMQVNTNTEQAIDLVQIDTKTRTIYMTRVGAGDDRIFTY